jgi:amino acid transporter
VHSKYHTPHVAILIHGVLLLALALSGTFERLAVFANLVAFVLYGLCACAVWVLRKKDIRSDGAPFLMPGGPLIPIATCVVSICLIAVTAGRNDAIGIAGAVAIALVLYWTRQLALTRRVAS